MQRPSRQFRRRALALALLFAVLIGTMLFSLSRGGGSIPMAEALGTLVGGESRRAAVALFVIRLPRILMSVLAGATLSLAGALIQSVLHYPLASPGTLGMVNGSALGVVLFYAVFTAGSSQLLVSVAWVPVAAFAGGAGTTLLLMSLVRRFTLGRRDTVVLGVSLAFGAMALTTLFMIVGPFYRASDANLWLTGATHTANWRELTVLAPIFVAVMLTAAGLGKTVDALRLDPRSASSLGIPRGTTTAVLLFAGLASSGAVAFVGGISFLGLMAPHAARLLVGSQSRWFFPAAALLGAELLVVADYAGRTLVSWVEVPSGALVAVAGAPFFLVLLFRETRSKRAA
jgi:iron complex transport system permease protein